VDPRALADLSAALERNDWLTADRATRALIGTEAGPVLPADIARLPSPVLIDIDSRWSACSGAALGFAVQARLWRELGGVAQVLVYEDMSADEKRALGQIEGRFAKRVDWVSADGVWAGPRYDATARQAPGALPYLPLMCSYGYGLVGMNLAALASRFG